MPLIPTTSRFITGLRASAAAFGEINLPETIVVRGYLGPPTEVLRQANDILGLNNAAAAEIIDPAAIDNIEANPVDTSPWRVYLSARRDCWVEIPSWSRCVAYFEAESSSDREDAFTVWLRKDDGRLPYRYRVVTVDMLDADQDTFVSGRLVHDYMSHGASANVVWDEQQFGPTTGKISTKYCF